MSVTVSERCATHRAFVDHWDILVTVVRMAQRYLLGWTLKICLNKNMFFEKMFLFGVEHRPAEAGCAGWLDELYAAGGVTRNES